MLAAAVAGVCVFMAINSPDPVSAGIAWGAAAFLAVLSAHT
jgi:hypothetical protein